MQYDVWWKMVLVVVDYWRKLLVVQALTKNTFGCGSRFLCNLWGFLSSFCSWKRDTQICCSIRHSDFVRFCSFFPEKYTACMQKASTEQHPILLPGKQMHGLYKQSFWRSCLSLSLFYPKNTTLLFFYHLLSSLSPFSSLLQHIAVAIKPRTKNSFLLCFRCSTFCRCNKEPECKSWRGRRSSYNVVHT